MAGTTLEQYTDEKIEYMVVLRQSEALEQVAFDSIMQTQKDEMLVRIRAETECTQSGMNLCRGRLLKTKKSQW